MAYGSSQDITLTRPSEVRSDALLGCPFCGSDELFDCDNARDGWYVMCSACGATIDDCDKSTVHRLWNRRQPNAGSHRQKEDGMWTHIEDTTPKARKDHRCTLCGLTIPKGVKHVKRVGADSGEGLVTMRMHEQCEMITRDWSYDDWDAMPDEWAFRHEELPPETLTEIQSMSNAGSHRQEES